MREHYDFSTARKNRYAAKLRKPVTIRLRSDVIDYFKAMSEETGMTYQGLINLYLGDCVQRKRKVKVSWDK